MGSFLAIQFLMTRTASKVFPVIFHQSQEKIKENISDNETMEVRIFHLLHFEQISAFRVIKEFRDFLTIIDLKLFQSFKQLLEEFVRKWRVIFFIDHLVLI